MPRSRMIVDSRFIEDAAALEKPQQTKLWKQLKLFSNDPQHPSLGRKIVRGASERVWELRVDDDYRVIFEENEDQFPVLLAVAKHDEALRFAERWRGPEEVMRRVEEITLRVKFPTRLPMELSELKDAVTTRKYLPLTQFLSGQTVGKITLTFAELEKILGSELPPSARHHRPWWANSRHRHVQSSGWLGAGWQVSEVDLILQRVRFSRLISVTKS